MLYAAVFGIVSVGIPLAGAIVFWRQRDGTLWSFLVGAAGFLISQPLLRIPILAWLSENSEWYMLMPYENTVAYYLLLGLSAGIFEEGSRWIGLAVFRKKQTAWADGFAYGLGHGGCEAAWLFVTQVLPAVSNGQAGAGLLLGAWERFFTMLVHIGLTFVVFYGVKNRRLRFFFLAVILHGLIDFLLILGNVWVLEGLIALEGIGAAIFAGKLRRRWAEPAKVKKD